MVAGNTEMLLADVTTEKVIKVGPHHKNHATSATMAFRKEFLKHTSFRLSDKSGEEMHFLKNWSVPVVQLKPNDTILALAHGENTVSKSHLFKGTEVQGSIDTYLKMTKYCQFCAVCGTHDLILTENITKNDNRGWYVAVC